MTVTDLSAAADPADFLADWFEGGRLPPAQQAVLDGYYAGYRRHFGPRLRHFYADQLREVTALARPGTRLLEVGCGCGTESLWLAQQGAAVTAIDVREDRLDVARARAAALGLDVSFARRNLLDLPTSAPFDIVWMEQAFHHLEPRADVVRHIAALLKPGGHVAISEANGANPLLQAQLFARRGLKTIDTYDDDGVPRPYGNERVLTAGALARLFADAGIECRSLRWFRLWPNRPWAEALAGIERWRWLPTALFTHYNYVGRKLAT
jgi:2-polyprenyl-3-methyl-5-hydroxy-6-metoxy-1,4-benzoquinol methylase